MERSPLQNEHDLGSSMPETWISAKKVPKAWRTKTVFCATVLWGKEEILKVKKSTC
jgi:hypothetical protein